MVTKTNAAWYYMLLRASIPVESGKTEWYNYPQINSLFLRQRFMKAILFALPPPLALSSANAHLCNSPVPTLLPPLCHLSISICLSYSCFTSFRIRIPSGKSSRVVVFGFPGSFGPNEVIRMQSWTTLLLCYFVRVSQQVQSSKTQNCLSYSVW